MAVKVTDILQQILTAQQRRSIDGAEAMKRILEELRRQVLAELAAAPAESFTAYRMQQTLREVDRFLGGAEQSLRTELASGISDAGELGRTMLPELAKAGSGVTLSTFGISTHLTDQIQEFAWGRITAVRNDIQAKIRAELSLGILGQKSPQEVAAAIAGSLGDKPGVFKGVEERAEVIAKVEMGRAFSMASQASMANAMATLPEMKKMWLHAGHPKSPRFYHLNLNGTVIPVEDKFLVGNIGMMYPRDPTAPASEVVNCGCMMVPYMEEWGTKADFLKSWSKAQKAANTKR